MIMPSEVDEHVGRFDRFAAAAAHLVGRARFFAACVALVIIWLPSYFAIRDVDSWQLVINTTTTIVTFLLLALLSNTEGRANAATQQKLNAVAHGLAGLMHEYGLEQDAAELRSAESHRIEEDHGQQ